MDSQQHSTLWLCCVQAASVVYEAANQWADAMECRIKAAEHIALVRGTRLMSLLDFSHAAL